MAEPLSPEQIDALLRPDPRTTAADLLVLRDALLRLGDACERLAEAAGSLHQVADEIVHERRAPLADAAGEPPDPPPTPPRAD